MRIIFLDIDGVLVNEEALKAHAARLESDPDAKQEPCADCVAALNWLTSQSEAKIVVSSTWRLQGFAVVKAILAEWGVTGEVIGATPMLEIEETRDWGTIYVSASRAEEIQSWLSTHERRIDAPRIEAFVILDDEREMGPLSSRLIRTKFEPGLTMQDAGRALALMRGEKPWRL